MKTIKKISAFALAAVVICLVTFSCKKDNSSGGDPSISYIRVTSPTSSDSLLVAGGQGTLIAIVGQNLQDAKEVWFNDQQASLTATYITSTTILVRVPNPIPKTISNKIKIVFRNGFVLYHDFTVTISEPHVNNMLCEFVNTGDVATIRGDYFYEPLTVTFAGGIKGDLVSVKDQEIQVRIPAGVQPGAVTVKTNFGETKSDFWFRDNRNLLITDDPWTGWWGQNLVVPATDPLAINGSFTRMTQKIGAWGWTEMIGGPPDAIGATSKNIPDDAVLNPAKYYLKFEVNTLKPYNNNRVKIMLGRVTNPDPNWDTEPYFWDPPFDTKGKWQTVSIPLEQVVAHFASWVIRPDGYGVKVWFHGPGDLDADMAFDNFRVVPKVSK
jgi:Surface glycan-binding protein B xyloglucan binding domain